MISLGLQSRNRPGAVRVPQTDTLNHMRITAVETIHLKHGITVHAGLFSGCGSASIPTQGWWVSAKPIRIPRPKRL